MSSTDLSPLSSRTLGFPGPRTVRATPEVGRQEVGRLHLPRGFRPIKGLPTDVRFGGTVPQNEGRTYAQKEGLRYEQKVHDVLSAIYGDDYTPHPSILYRDRRGLRRAIPDGTLRIGAMLVVVEVKLSHTERAWWQLIRLYVPLLSRLYPPGTRIAPVEICRSYDPAISLPYGELITSLHRPPLGGLGILQWRL